MTKDVRIDIDPRETVRVRIEGNVGAVRTTHEGDALDLIVSGPEGATKLSITSYGAPAEVAAPRETEPDAAPVGNGQPTAPEKPKAKRKPASRKSANRKG